MKKLTLNQRGFSLIELMVVVVIIGLLATVAIPNYQRFQRRAIQTEAKAALSALYTAERTFITEWSYGTMNLDLIGYDSTGSPFYVMGWNTNDNAEVGGVVNETTAGAQTANGYRGPVATDKTRINTFVTIGQAGFHLDAQPHVNGTLIPIKGSCAAATGGGTCACDSAPGCAVSGTHAPPATACGGCAYGSAGVNNTTSGLNGVGFTIGAAGNIGGSAVDEWTIDADKDLRNVKSGI